MIPQRHNSIARAASAAPAAPAGGGPIAGCRGCGIFLTAVGVIATLGCISTAQAQVSDPNLSRLDPVSVPSAQVIYLQEVIADEAPGDLWLRFRFVAPNLSVTGQAEHALERDMAHLCDHVALPYIETHKIAPARISVSLADRIIPFGQAAPNATQFFELFSAGNATCIWEAF